MQAIYIGSWATVSSDQIDVVGVKEEIPILSDKTKMGVLTLTTHHEGLEGTLVVMLQEFGRSYSKDSRAILTTWPEAPKKFEEDHMQFVVIGEDVVFNLLTLHIAVNFKLLEPTIVDPGTGILTRFTVRVEAQLI